jgi:hypothetical protein
MTPTTISAQLDICPKCCEHYEPLFGKHTCRQPQTKPLGYLYQTGVSVYVRCAKCGPAHILPTIPLFEINLGQYRQPCAVCGKEINPNANPEHWPVLFD